MQRIRSYTVPHKGLRNALSQVSLLAGKTNYSDKKEVEALFRLGSDVFKLLTIHAKDEDQVSLSELEARVPGSSTHDREEHQEIHAEQSKLESLLSKIHADTLAGKDASLDGEEFYLAWSEFHGEYLGHTAEEERNTQQLLWKHFTDEELSSHRGKAIAKNPPETMLIWFRFVIPAQNHEERVSLLSDFKKLASEDYFGRAMETIKAVITRKEFESLVAAI